MLIEDSWAFGFALFGTIGSLATAVALYFLWKQSHQTEVQLSLARQEFESTLRPWIGVSKINKKSNQKIVLYIKNYGRIPAIVFRTRGMVSNTRINKEELRSFEFQDAQIMVFPEGVMTYTIPVPKEVPPNYEYIGFFLEYEYFKDKHGEYGFIAKRKIETETFSMLEIFSS